MSAQPELWEFPDADSWDAWLQTNHGTAPEAWLRIRRKGAEVPLLAVREALDVALCHGWIDGVRRSLDGVSFRQRFSPRRPRSSWSQVNVARVEELEAEGRMRPGGLAEVAAARADGRWAAAYPRQADSEPPPDLMTALAADPEAAAAFAALGRTARFAVVLPLLKATTPQRRELLVHRAVERLHQVHLHGENPLGERPGEVG